MLERSERTNWFTTPVTSSSLIQVQIYDPSSLNMLLVRMPANGAPYVYVVHLIWGGNELQVILERSKSIFVLRIKTNTMRFPT